VNLLDDGYTWCSVLNPIHGSLHVFGRGRHQPILSDRSLLHDTVIDIVGLLTNYLIFPF